MGSNAQMTSLNDEPSSRSIPGKTPPPALHTGSSTLGRGLSSPARKRGDSGRKRTRRSRRRDCASTRRSPSSISEASVTPLLTASRLACSSSVPFKLMVVRISLLQLPRQIPSDPLEPLLQHWIRSPLGDLLQSQQVRGLQRLLRRHFHIRLDAVAFPILLADRIDRATGRHPHREMIVHFLRPTRIR